MSMFQKILRAGEGRTLKRLEQRVREVNDLEPEYEALSDDQLAAKTIEFRERFDQGEDLDDLLPEAFAAVREASKRTVAMRPFDVQLIGGMVLHEVDSSVTDEARTPLIISGGPEQAAETYYAFARAVKNLEPGEDYEVDEKFHTASPTEQGVDKVEKVLRIDNLYAPENGQLVNHLIQAIKAKELYKRDDEYVVMDGEVKIVDEFTGRIMEGRRWPEGLHQAVEAKEGVRIQEENVTVATVTIQNYFRLYTESGKLAGMTGTAITEANEFHEIYGLEVVPIPTHRPMIRADQNDQIYRTKDEKFNAVVEDIVERNR